VTDGRTRAQIGLWGGTQSGKTTFLAALRIATLESDLGHWRLAGREADSSTFLIERTNDLLYNRKFPEGDTQGKNPYEWLMSGDRPLGLVDWLRRLLGGKVVSADSFVLTVQDVPGKWFEDGRGTQNLNGRVEVLSNCAGIIYLYDPTQENNFRSLQTILDNLYSKADREGRLCDDGRLNHHLAVCVTKVDATDVFAQLMKAEAVQVEPVGAPRATVIAIDGERAFRSMAPEPVLRSIDSYFPSDRVAYFATSAIGFFVGEDGLVDLEHPTNTCPDEGGREAVRGRVHPLNVLEPLLWLREVVGARIAS
jgi:hypothetical protein